MRLFTYEQGKHKQLQRALDRQQTHDPMTQAEEYIKEQDPQARPPIFKEPRKQFAVDLMVGWEKP